MSAMRRKSTSEILHSVDPTLKIIPRNTKRSRKMRNHDWNKAAGEICPECHQEAFRFHQGVCINCANGIEADRLDKQEEKAEKSYFRKLFLEGKISTTQLMTRQIPDR